MMYFKQLYVPSPMGNLKATIRPYTQDDFEGLIQIQKESFPPPFPSELWWNVEQLTNHCSLFPEGALCIEIEGELAGSITTLRVQFDPNEPYHTWDVATDHGYIRNHDPNGNTLYVVDICIRPKYRKLDLGNRLLHSMYELVVHKGMERLLGGGRMPGYHKYADQLTAKQYVTNVIDGSIKDPVISFMLRCGRTPVAVVENYLEDEESLHYGVLMEWKNPFLL